MAILMEMLYTDLLTKSKNAFVYFYFFSTEKYVKLNISGRCDNNGDVSPFLASSLLSDCPFMSKIQFLSQYFAFFLPQSVFTDTF